MGEPHIRFLPFHAINEFMTDDYRKSVVRSTLLALPDLPEERRLTIERLSRQLVTVPGFRNGSKAPPQKRIHPTIAAFEKNPALVAAILAAWADLHSGLRQQVYDLLVARGWELLPPEADRAQLPGFQTTWPPENDFDAINAAFQEMYPQAEATANDISLMAVWLSLRLPYQIEGADDEEGSAEDDEA